MADYSSPAVLRGGVYCAPWCGFNCKRASYERATREADQLAARLGNGWVAHVWENGGWHYCVENGRNHVGPLIRGGTISGDWVVYGYTAWLQAGTAENPCMVQIIERGETPEDALGFATQKARTLVSEFTASLNAMLEGMPA